MSEEWRWKVPDIKLEGDVVLFELVELLGPDLRRSSAPRKRRRRPLRNFFCNVLWKLGAIVFYLDTTMNVRRREKTTIKTKVFLYSIL